MTAVCPAITTTLGDPSTLGVDGSVIAPIEFHIVRASTIFDDEFASDQVGPHLERRNMSGLKRVVENTIPVLRVSDLKRSLDFYTNTLDFKVDWGDDEGRIIASVSKDGCPIMLSQFSTIGTPGR